LQELKEWIKSFIIAFIIAIPISFFCRPAIVEGYSMQPTLDDKNILLTERNMKDLKRGEVVVFDARPTDEHYYIKRVIGLPGDNVEIKDGLVYVNGSKIDEPYLRRGTLTEPAMKVKVPQGQVFVLGDNREVSQDSRYIGTIDIKKIKGHAYFRVFPFNEFGKFD
jgi:signal peptidase I